MTTTPTIFTILIAAAALAGYTDFARHRDRFNRLRRMLMAAGMTLPAVSMTLLTIFQSSMEMADVVARLGALGVLGGLGIRIALDPYLSGNSSAGKGGDSI